MGIEAVLLGAALVGSAVAAGGTIMSGVAQSQQAKHNAKVGELQARDAEQRGQTAEDQHRRRVRQFAGAQKAQLAAQGVDVGSGSASDLIGDTAALGELDALTIRNNTAREAWGYRAQAAGARHQAGAAMASGLIGGAGTLLGGAAGAAAQYRTMKLTS
jgi:hypothetical protein